MAPWELEDDLLVADDRWTPGAEDQTLAKWEAGFKDLGVTDNQMQMILEDDNVQDDLAYVILGDSTECIR